MLEQARTLLLELTPNPWELISKSSLLNFLDAKQGSPYDRYIFEQLYERMNKNPQGYVTINDFLDVLAQADDSLQTKLRTTREDLERNQQLLTEYHLKLQNAKQTEKFNTYNIMMNSAVNIVVIEAQVYFPGVQPVYVAVGCNKIHQTTNMAPRNNAIFSNQQFDFPINTGQEIIQVVLMDQECETRQEIGGIAQIELSRFYDQLRQDIWVDLKDRMDVVLRGRVRLSVQWIHSKQQYLSQLISENDQEQQNLQADISDYQNDLIFMYAPFQQQTDRTQQGTMLPIAHSQRNNTKSLYLPQPQPRPLVQSDLDQILQQSVYLILLYVLVAIFCSFERTVYFDFIVTFYAVGYFKSNSSIVTGLPIKSMSVAIAFSIILDIAWLTIYSNPWWLSEGSKLTSIVYEQEIHRAVVVLSYILLGVKVAVLILFLYVSFNIPKAPSFIQDDKIYEAQTYEQQATSQWPPVTFGQEISKYQ